MDTLTQPEPFKSQHVGKQSLLLIKDNIMNYYGVFEFINENNRLEYGYLMELKPNKKGKWKLLKANRPTVKRNEQGNTSPGEEYINRALDQDLDFELY